jgi:hypothetical protein
MQTGDYVYADALCKAPCSAIVPIGGGPYQIEGVAQVPSARLELFPSNRGLDVRAHFGSGPAYVVGAVLTILGATYTMLGTGLLTTWAAMGEPPVVNHTPGVFLPVGVTFALVGLHMLGVGLPLFLTQGTNVEVVEWSEPKQASHAHWTAQGFAF